MSCISALLEMRLTMVYVVCYVVRERERERERQSLTT